jgi:hypothetical protein
MWWSVIEHVSQLGFMIAIVTVSRTWSRRAQEERQRTEAERLRSALKIGISALRTRYEGNLRILAHGDLPLVSARNQICLLRTQFGRLTCLEAPEIEAVMAASVAAECVESEMAIAGGKLGAVVFEIPKRRAAQEVLRSRLRDACSLLATAEQHLGPREMPGGEPALGEQSADTRCAGDFREPAAVAAPDNVARRRPPLRAPAAVGEMSG